MMEFVRGGCFVDRPFFGTESIINDHTILWKCIPLLNPPNYYLAPLQKHRQPQLTGSKIAECLPSGV